VARQKKGRMRFKGHVPEATIAFEDKVLRNISLGESEKSALRRYEISSEDELQLGMKSSGWKDYLNDLRAELALVRRLNVSAADAIARVWNGKGFKTGYGKTWNARLVKIAKVIAKS